MAPAQAHSGHGDVPVGGASRFHVVQGLSETNRKAPPALDVLGYVFRPFGGIRGGLRGHIGGWAVRVAKLFEVKVAPGPT